MLRMSEVNAADHQAMQHMLTSECVDWAGLRGVVAAEANGLLGGDDAVFIIDESGFAKKGEASAGVARQWNGRLGKVDNSQVGVFAALCRGEMSCLIDSRLYLPLSLVSDSERCKQAAVPKAEQRYRAQSELALEMVDEADRRGVRYGDVAVDGGYGKEPAPCVAWIAGASVSSRMCTRIRGCTWKTRNCACPSGRGVVAARHVPLRRGYRYGSMPGRRHNRRRAGGAWSCAKGRRA